MVYMRKHKKIKIIVEIVILLVLLGAFIFTLCKDKEHRTILVDTQATHEQEIIEKNNIIEEKEKTVQEKENQIQQLEEEKANLTTQIEELNKQIEELKISKAKKVTSRSTATRVASTDDWIWGNISAYCPCAKCCGKTNGITASGVRASANHTIAASSAYSFGTKIEIEGLGIFTVEDRGGAIQGNKIDVFFNSHQEALNFGRKQLRIRVVP